MIASIGQRLYGSAVIAQHLRGQRALPYWPRERIEVLRDRRVRAIVAYAAAHVPYYREMLARERIDAASIRGAADLERLPVLDKDLVRSHPSAFVAETSAGRHGLTFSTSGTTGRATEIRHDRRSLLANIAFGERERDPVIKAAGGVFRPKEIYVGYETSTFKKVQAFYDESTLLPVKPKRIFVSLLEPIEKIAALNAEEKPDMLVGYGGWIDLFFKTVAARGLPLHKPKMAMYMGEALPHGARDFIEGGLGIPLLSRYNAVESFKIGYYCERRTGFHLHDDLCHVRVVDAEGNDKKPGEQGHILISNLVNRATVLLNYPIGDVGALATAACACGRTLRLLSELEGRVEDILPLPDGRFVHPRSVWQVMKEDPEVLQYQLVQHEPQIFSLQLITVDDAAFARAEAKAVPALLRLLGASAKIDTSRGKEVHRGEGGKFRAVASQCSRGAAPLDTIA